MKLRNFKKTDAFNIYNIVNGNDALHLTNGNKMTLEECIAFPDELIAKVLIAEDEKGFIGYCAYRKIKETLGDKKQDALIFDLAIAQVRRNKGLGKKLYAQFEEIIKKEHPEMFIMTEVNSKDLHIRKFLQTMGYSKLCVDKESMSYIKRL